jgi:hypothetical protein
MSYTVWLECTGCGTRDDVSGEDYGEITTRFMEAHRYPPCGRVLLCDTVGLRKAMVSPERRAAPRARGIGQVIRVPCPSGCGALLTLDIAKGHQPGHTATCDRCGAQMKSMGAVPLGSERAS